MIWAALSTVIVFNIWGFLYLKRRKNDLERKLRHQDIKLGKQDQKFEATVKALGFRITKLEVGE